MKILKRLKTRNQPCDESLDLKDVRCFFICGYMRSGTNWAHNLLNLHPHIASHGEYMFNFLREPFDEWLQRKSSVHRQLNVIEEVEQLFEQFIKASMYEAVKALPKFRDRRLRWLGDRSPRLLAPSPIRGSKHFRMIRDGRDVLVSWTFWNLAQDRLNVFANHPEMQKKQKIFADDCSHFVRNPKELLTERSWVEMIGRQWNRRVVEDEKAIQQLQSNDADGEVMSIRYEDLHADTEGTREKMYRFLDLDPSLAEPLDSGRRKTSAGISSERPDSLYRKGIVGDWENYLDEETEEWFRAIACDSLDVNGYR